MKKAAVVGGAGFIGSNIANTLINRGVEVTVVDNLSTGLEENINSKAIQDLNARMLDKNCYYYVSDKADRIILISKLNQLETMIIEKKCLEDLFLFLIETFIEHKDFDLAMIRFIRNSVKEFFIG